jgi:hypothetical protein
MVDELATYGIETMVTFWPFQSTGSRHWEQFQQSGYLVNAINATAPTSYDGGDQYLVDETNPEVRRAVFDGFWEGYGVYGIKVSLAHTPKVPRAPPPNPCFFLTLTPNTTHAPHAPHTHPPPPPQKKSLFGLTRLSRSTMGAPWRASGF